MIARSTAVILCHCYYTTDLYEIDENILFFDRILANLSSETPFPLLKDTGNEILWLRTPNKGKDIGGKLALIDLFLNLTESSEYIVFLHDKKSPHSALGSKWKKDLFKIIDPNVIPTIISLFEKNRNIGIIANKDYVKNEYDPISGEYNTTNNNFLKEIMKKYQIFSNNFFFVAGTMFWIRASIIRKFFLKVHPLDIRAELETGNILDNDEGTKTHSWERLFSFIAQQQNYIIKGI